ncbi:MAG: DUF5810 domain-containing protein [Haloarculaceae archaeon]
MGYACPVCTDPQADAEHLANHLAFTAMLGDEAHEAWLDEHAPGWQDGGADDLAPRVTAHAAETEFPQVFEDTTHDHDHDHEHDDERSGALFDDEPAFATEARDSVRGARDLDGDAADIMEEARALTRQIQDGEDGQDGDPTADGDADEAETE